MQQIPQQQRQQQQQQAQQVQQRAWQQTRAQSFDSQHRDWQQRGGYKGERVPDSYFNSHYGENHAFRLRSTPYLFAGGSLRFQYGNYWFNFADSYPEYWGNNWYQTDDVYVAYSNDGYYLYNRRFPGRPGVAVDISSQNYGPQQREEEWQRHRAHNWESEHRSWEERGGYNGYWVPDSYFGSHYGRYHSFQLASLPFTEINSLPAFRYGDYWFTFVDPIPEYWSSNWDETDHVYIDYYGDGYYLFNRRYPNTPGIAISFQY